MGSGDEQRVISQPRKQALAVAVVAVLAAAVVVAGVLRVGPLSPTASTSLPSAWRDSELETFQGLAIRGNTLFVQQHSRLLRSTDRGKTWRVLPTYAQGLTPLRDGVVGVSAWEGIHEASYARLVMFRDWEGRRKGRR